MKRLIHSVKRAVSQTLNVNFKLSSYLRGKSFFYEPS